jgi:predicted outer membrane repeat protein
LYKKITKIFLFICISLFSNSVFSNTFISLDKVKWSNLKNYVSFNEEKKVFELIVSEEVKTIYIKNKNKIKKIDLKDKETKVLNIIVQKKNVLFVAEGKTGSGFSWFDPMGDIQKAINKQSKKTENIFKKVFIKLYPDKIPDFYAIYIDRLPKLVKEKAKSEVWVKKGFYTPNSSPNKLYNEDSKVKNLNRLNHFALKRFVSLIGAFEGFETRKEDRDFKNIKKTILSGKINENKNIYHVFFHHISSKPNGLEETLLDGFTVENGSAENKETLMHQNGGGMLNIGDSEDVNLDEKIPKPYKTLRIKNCVFQNNFAKNSGGAIYNLNYLPILENCIFIENKASQGGAIYTSKTSSEDSFYIHEYFFTKKLSESFNENLMVTIKEKPIKTIASMIYPSWIIELYSVIENKIKENDFPNFLNQEQVLSFFNIEFKDLKSKILNSINYIKEGFKEFNKIEETKLRIKNCKFIKNRSENYGGAIFNDNLYFSISNSNFENNTSCLGGAICNNNCNNDPMIDSEIKESYFKNNFSEETAACIYSKTSFFMMTKEGTIVISDCEMIDNYANSFDNSSEIYLENSKTEFINTKIIENEKYENNYRIIAKESPVIYDNLDMEKGKKFIEKNGETKVKKHKERKYMLIWIPNGVSVPSPIFVKIRN